MKTSGLFIIPVDEKQRFTTTYELYIRRKRERGELIGKMWFCGEPSHGRIEIKFEIDSKYRDKGYATEALREITDWAFMQKGVYEIVAYADHDNDAALAVLTKAKYIYRTIDNHIEEYSIIKPKTTWLGLYVCIGFFIGPAIGIVIQSPALGTVIGMTACILAGLIMDSKDRTERKTYYG